MRDGKFGLWHPDLWLLRHVKILQTMVVKECSEEHLIKKSTDFYASFKFN